MKKVRGNEKFIHHSTKIGVPTMCQENSPDVLMEQLIGLFSNKGRIRYNDYENPGLGVGASTTEGS